VGHKNAATLFRSTVVSAVLDQLLLFLVHSIYTKLIYNAAVVDLPASPMYCCCTTLEKIFSSKTVSQHTSSNKLCGYVAATICPHPTLTFDLEVGVGVACDLGYPCAKFRLPRPFGFRVRADVRDIRQTDADHRLIPPPPIRGGGIIRGRALQPRRPRLPSGSIDHPQKDSLLSRD